MGKEFTLEDVEIARIKILENAEELITESELLFTNGKYARAYTLAHLACEELSKIAMIVNSMAQSIVYGETNWKKLNDRLVRHTEKFRSVIITKMDKIDGFIELLNVKPEHLEKKLNNLKNESLYSGKYKNGEYCKPSEIINKEISYHMLDLAKDYYNYYGAKEELNKGKLTELQTDKEFKKNYMEIMDLVKQYPMAGYFAVEIFEANGLEDIEELKNLIFMVEFLRENNIKEEDLLRLLRKGGIMVNDEQEDEESR
jgi:AbiV family abortive infection protein